MKDETLDSAPPLLGVGSREGCAGSWGMEVSEAFLDFLGVEGMQVQISDPEAKFYISGNIAGGKADLKSPMFCAVCRWRSPLSDLFFKSKARVLLLPALSHPLWIAL